MALSSERSELISDTLSPHGILDLYPYEYQGLMTKVAGSDERSLWTMCVARGAESFVSDIDSDSDDDSDNDDDSDGDNDYHRP